MADQTAAPQLATATREHASWRPGWQPPTFAAPREWNTRRGALADAGVTSGGRQRPNVGPRRAPGNRRAAPDVTGRREAFHRPESGWWRPTCCRRRRCLTEPFPPEYPSVL